MNVVAQSLFVDAAELSTESARNPLDVAIVGGGPTGLTAARVLAEHNIRVGVLEAGPFVLPTHAWSSDLRFSDGAVRDLQQRLTYHAQGPSGSQFGSMVSCLGGRGIFWNGAAPRFLPRDFAAWPISPSELREHYRWAERELFVSRRWGQTRLARWLRGRLIEHGIQAEAEPFAIDSGPSINGHLTGTIGNPVSILLRSGLYSPTSGGLRPRVALNARVTRVDLGPQSAPLALAVEEGGEQHHITARHLILAAGGFESVRLALASSMPDSSGTLGAFLADHWFVRAYFPLPAGAYAQSAPEAAAVLVRPGPEGYQIELHAPGRRFFTAEWPWHPDATDEYAVMVRAFAPIHGGASSRIELLPGRGPGAYTVHFEPTDEQRAVADSMSSGLGRVREALDAGEARVDVLPLGSSYHEAGGLRMGATPDDGVVDRFGRLWGDSRIRVVDASAWPALGAANPHLTLVALAHRQALAVVEDMARS